MRNKEHECIIGEYYSENFSQVHVTEKELLEHYEYDVKSTRRFNEYVVGKDFGSGFLKVTIPWDKMFDGRCTSSPLLKYYYCPRCGKKIDWGRIKNKHQ